MITPCNNLLVSLNLNSAPFIDTKNQDNSMNLLFKIYKAILDENP